ncbi:MAG TPA: helix-turn-helix domain-containing protein [Cyclobacteriaceae bacterium]|jgi:transcriptional regulator with XRE-family HTH domain|nr:helix-turn-helix domain-containing protein [Cyclobacteriaceae bacterium]
MAETTHLGRKISRLRELRGITQETLAEQLGISQQAVSKIEQSEQVEDTTLERVAKALNVTPSAIRNFSEEILFNLIQNNTFHDHSTASTTNYQCTINPIEKITELYDALIKSEREKLALLEKLMEKFNEKK